jgi:hypothetical protein
MGRPTCESCISIDVRRWHREGRLQAGRRFSWSWTHDGQPANSINVRTERDAVSLSWGAGGSIEQRVPITWTECHLGGRRPWFVCSAYSNSRCCGRRAAVLYAAPRLFACRRCCGLAYASQQEALRHRGVYRVQKIRMRLGGSASLREPFPEKPERMHWRTYLKLRMQAETAEDRSNIFLMQWFNRNT